MILSYREFMKVRRRRIEASITTGHPASSYGQPVIMLPNGETLDLLSWLLLDYRVKRATKKELALLGKMDAHFMMAAEQIIGAE